VTDASRNRSAAESVGARLDAEVRARRLDEDSAQRSAALRLDALCDALASPPAGVLGTLRAALSRLTAKPAPAPIRGLYLWGGVGRGKTLLMDLFFACLRSRAIAAERKHFHHFMRDVHGELGTIARRQTPLDLVAKRLAGRIRVICLDEFHVGDIADAMLLGGLFEALFRRGVTLVSTSNVRPEDLYQDGLQRQRFLPAIDLLLAHVEVLHLDGGVDYRLRQLEQAPTYLDANLPGTTHDLRQRFAALATAAAGPVTLCVEGRALRALDAAPGTVWFDFRELCEGPRSQNDYIELARLYNTVFISNIPVFEPADDDAARRFVMLIDEFYDRRVKIVVSAAAPPAALYRGERLRFPFERASSRLIEMQTQQYLAGGHRP
jgi:cell division protein ZapE